MKVKAKCARALISYLKAKGSERENSNKLCKTKLYYATCRHCICGQNICRHLTLKTLFLLAISSLKRVGDLQALSVAPTHLDFAPGMAKAFLYSRVGYVPKVPHVTPQPVILQAFSPPPFGEPEQQKLDCVCPVSAMDAYVHITALWRRVDQLLVCYGPPKRGLPASKQTLSRWIVDAINIYYESSQLPSLMGVRAHSCGGLQGLFAGVPIHLQRCGMVDTLGLCQILWPWHAGHSRLFRPLALAVLRMDTYWAGTCKSGSMGISFPKRLWMQLEFLKRNILGVTYVTLVPRGNKTLSLGHTSGIPASATARAFISAGHNFTSPVTSCPSNGQIIHVFRAGHAEGIPKASLDAASRSSLCLGCRLRPLQY